MQHISATIITRNEEKNIERCLQTLQGVADEIVVVDSYSTDRTVEICQKYGCRVASREFRGFGSQRQYATGLTTHSYVLSIDADEVLDDTLRQALVDMKEHGFEHRVYAIEVKTYFCRSALAHSGFEPENQIRLFNKRYANWNLRDISDRVSYPDSVQPARLTGAIHHYRCATVDEFYRKENRIAALKAKVLAARGKSIAPFTPLFRGLAAFLRAHIVDQAWRDGAHGFIIANRRARTVFEAYRMARKILRESRS